MDIVKKDEEDILPVLEEDLFMSHLASWLDGRSDPEVKEKVERVLDKIIIDEKKMALLALASLVKKRYKRLEKGFALLDTVNEGLEADLRAGALSTVGRLQLRDSLIKESELVSRFVKEFAIAEQTESIIKQIIIQHAGSDAKEAEDNVPEEFKKLTPDQREHIRRTLGNAIRDASSCINGVDYPPLEDDADYEKEQNTFSDDSIIDVE